MLDASGHYRADEWAAKVVELSQALYAEVRMEVTGSHPEALVALIRNALGGGQVPLREVKVGTGKLHRAGILRQHFAMNRAHVVDYLPGLEQQMLTWAPDSNFSPDRVDACGHAVEGILGPMSTVANAAALDGARPEESPRERDQPARSEDRRPRLGAGRGELDHQQPGPAPRLIQRLPRDRLGHPLPPLPQPGPYRERLDVEDYLPPRPLSRFGRASADRPPGTGGLDPRGNPTLMNASRGVVNLEHLVGTGSVLRRLT